MASLAPNTFSSWNLTAEEAMEGSILTTTQKQVIQNLLADYAQEKLAIDYDPTDPMTFVQEEAHKKGQIEVLQFLLAQSDMAQEVLYPSSSITENTKEV